MQHDDPLLPPLAVLRDRLMRNQRERSLLRALFRLVVRASEDDREQPRQSAHEPRRQMAAGREVSRDS